MNPKWDIEINAEKKSLIPNLKEIWQYRDLVSLFVKRDFISIYKQTLLGPLWLFIQPLTTTFIYVFIFGRLANLGTDGLPKPLFYMLGIIAWTFFSETFTKTSGVFLTNSHIFSKVYFPRLIILISIFLSSLLRMLINSSLLIVLVLYYVFTKDFHPKLIWQISLLPIIILQIGMIGVGFGMIVSSLTIKYRDLNNLIQFGVQLLMYASPVVYSMASMPLKYKQFINFNPLAPLLESFRFCSFGEGEFSLQAIGYSSIWAIVIFIIGMITFKVSETDFVDSI